MSNLEIKKTRSFRSLTVTLAIAFLALNAVVLLIANCLNIYFTFQNQQKLIASQQQLIAQNAANIVRGFIQEKFGILKVAASLGKLIIAPLEEQKTILEKQLGLEPTFRQLVLLNTEEQELLRVSRISKLLSVQLMKYNKNELFSKVSQKKPYMSSTYIDEITSEPMVIMAVPVTDVFGDFKGILMAEVNLKFMWNLVDRIKIGKKGLAYVVDKQGNLIAFRDIGRVLKRENLLHLKEVNEFVKGDELIHKSSADVVKGIQGTQVVSNYEHLDTPDWAVVVELPVLEAYESVIEEIKLSVGTMLFSFILAILAGVYLSKKITKPIIRLRDATREVGKGDLSAGIKVESKDEIGELTLSFNQMLSDLHETTVSIEELRKEEKRFQDIAISTGEWIWEVDSEGRYTYSSPVVERILGYRSEEVLGKYFYDFFHPDERNELKNVVFEVFSRKELFHNFLNRNVHKDGHTVIMETSGVPIISSKGILLGYRGVDRDITERKQAEEQIKISLKEKETLLKEIHHRIKNNLQIISSLLNLQSNYLKDKLTKDVFLETKNRVRTMALVHEKLYKSKDLASIDLGEYITTLVHELFRSYKAKSKAIALDVSVDNISIDIDTAIPCGLIINELVSNSLKHAFHNNKPGEIHIGFHSKDTEYTLSVGDNGIGIPQNIDFHNTESLGLQLVCALTHQLNGSIELNRTNGTIFKVVFKH